MIPLDIAVFDDTQRLPVATWRGAAQISCGEHGYEAATIEIPASQLLAFDLYTRLSVSLRVLISAGGAEVWEGRGEDDSIQNGGATLVAYGRWRALSDAPYTALWSDTQFAHWRAVINGEIANRTPDRYGSRTDDSLFITLKKGAAYANNGSVGSIVYLPPDQGSRTITGFSIAYQVLLPTGWTFRIVAYTGSPGAFAGGSTLFTAPATTGALQTASVFTTFAGVNYIALEIFNSSGATYTNAQEDGDFYLNIPFARLVTLNSNRVNTTLGTAVAAPGTQACTPGSMTGIYVGQRLFLGGGNPESVVVASMTTTTFTATYARTHLATDSLNAFLLYASDVATALRDAVNTANSGALSSSNILIQSPGLDLLDEIYEDAYPADILTRLASLGDASGQRYEVGVKAGRRLYLRPQGDAAQAWHVDAADLTIQQTIENLANSVYATYQDANGYTRRTASQIESLSIVRYGLTRRRSVQADTTNSNVATAIAQTARDDSSDPLPRAGVSFTRAYTANGAQIPLWQIQDGDTITIRNLPVIAGAAVDRIRTFRVVQVQYDAVAGTISVTPETPLPELEYLLARRETFGERAAGRIGG